MRWPAGVIHRRDEQYAYERIDGQLVIAQVACRVCSRWRDPSRLCAEDNDPVCVECETHRCAGSNGCGDVLSLEQRESELCKYCERVSDEKTAAYNEAMHSPWRI